MGQPGSKTGSQGQILGKNLVKALNVMVLIGSWPNLVRLFVLMILRTSSNMGHLGSKTRSQGQILGKPY